MPAQNYNVFISYSRANQDQKKRLLTHLDSLAFDGTIAKPWHDRLIGAGDIWRSELETAMNEAEVALLLVSADFIASPFCQDVEVARILERHKNDGVLIVPIIVGHCSWKHIPWLSQFQVLPEDGKPVMSQVPRDKAWTQVIEGLRWQLENKPPHKKASMVEVAAKGEGKPRLFSLTRLLQTMPGETGDLFGREEALRWLDHAYANSDISVLALVGFGGVGKSALVRHWLETRFSEVEEALPRFLGVSFYSQGTREQEAGSSDQFLIQSLELLGEEHVAAKSAWDRGQRLAELLTEKPTVLVLDGLEPLQRGPGPHHLEGQLKDPGVHAMLAHLAEHPGKVLTIVSTRVPLTDDDLQSTSFVQKSLDILSPEAARDLMLARSVRGTDGEIAKAVEYLGRHPLALVMAAEYLHTFAEGDVNRLYEIPLLSEKTKEGRHAKSVMGAYEKSLELDGDPLDVELLGILGLFDRPTKWEWLKALSTAPPIKNVTDHLVNATDRELWESISRLRQWGMLADPGSLEAPQLDAHPLIREYFGERLKKQSKKGWREAHSRVFDYLVSTAKDFPNTLEEMEPLYQAIAHGCEASRHEEVLDEIYNKRILRGIEGFSKQRLGAFSADLAALTHFFNVPWGKLTFGLGKSAEAFILNQTSWALHALGRTTEALPLAKRSRRILVSRREWTFASILSVSISDMLLNKGDLDQMVASARYSINLSNKSREIASKIAPWSMLANGLIQMGRYNEAETCLQKVEKIEKIVSRESSYSYTLWRFFYCDLLLSQELSEVAETRATEALKIAKSQHGLLEVALGHLFLGKARLLISKQKDTADYSLAANSLNLAVDSLLKAGDVNYLPSGLLTRAELNRSLGNLILAEHDLGKAFNIAARGEMGLRQADCQLEYARLYLAMKKKNNEANINRQNKEKAREHWETAREMIEQMGYHRRDKDVKEIEEQLNS